MSSLYGCNGAPPDALTSWLRFFVKAVAWQLCEKCQFLQSNPKELKEILRNIFQDTSNQTEMDIYVQCVWLQWCATRCTDFLVTFFRESSRATNVWETDIMNWKQKDPRKQNMDSEEFAEPLGTPKPYSRQGFILTNLSSIENKDLGIFH